MRMTKKGVCATCKKEGVELTQHHPPNKKENIIMICKDCHRLFNEGYPE